MVTMIFKANLITDPVQVENKNGNSNMHVRLRLGAKVAAKDPNSNYLKSIILDGSLWGRQAELAMSSLHKGSNILVYATVYDIVANNGSDGKTYINTSLNITSFEFLDSRVESSNIQAAAPASVPQTPVNTTQITNNPMLNNNITNGSFTQPPAWATVQQEAPSMTAVSGATQSTPTSGSNDMYANLF